MKIGQAHHVHAFEVELPQSALADGNRRHHTCADAALVQDLRHHLGCCAIEFGPPRKAEDGRWPRLLGGCRAPVAGLIGGTSLLADMVLDLADDTDGRVCDEPPVVRVRGAALTVVLSQAQGRDRDIVVELPR